MIHSNPGEIADRNLDTVPFPDRTLLNLDNYYTAVDRNKMTTTYSSRGCPFRCVFCDVQEKLYHYRSAARVVDEFEEIIKLGIKEIHIFDDIFNVRPKRVIEVCDEIKARNLKVHWSIRARVNPFTREMIARLKEAGCGRIHVGVESLDPATLKYMNKKQTYEEIQDFFKMCHEEGMETLAYFIIGFPTESPEYRKRFYDEVMKINPTYCFFNILFPLAKTQYYQSLLDDGTFEKDHWEEYCKDPQPYFEIPLPRSPELQQSLEDLADRWHRKFCFRLGFLYREFWSSVRYPKMMLLKTKLVWVLLRETIKWRRKKNGERQVIYIGSDKTRVIHS
jgi:anaerobic magnesium-protoporphyrin IX monomethyl ester cyclase